MALLPSLRNAASFVTVGASLVGSIVLLAHCSSESSETSDPPDAATGDAQPKPAPDAPDPTDAAPTAPAMIETERSGTRFRVVRTQTIFDDDAVLVSPSGEFYDKATKSFCSLAFAGDDRYACLPLHVQAGTEDEFGDAACSEPIVAFTPTSLNLTHVVWGPSCAPRLGRVGPVTKTATSYRKNPVTHACEVARTGVSTAARPIAIAPSQFGIWTRVRDDVTSPGDRNGTRLTVVPERIEGDDGAFAVVLPRIIDTEAGVRASGGSAASGRVRVGGGVPRLRVAADLRRRTGHSAPRRGASRVARGAQREDRPDERERDRRERARAAHRRVQLVGRVRAP